MKILLNIIQLSIIFNLVYSECDQRSEKGIKECYDKFFEALNFKIVQEAETITYPRLEKISDNKFCKLLEEKSKCLGNVEHHCLNVEKFSKVIGISDAEAVKFLLFDYSSQYSCKNGKEYKPKEKAVDCEASINFTEECSLVGRGCKMAKNLYECYKHVLEYNCNDKKWIQFRTNTWKYAVERTWSLCHF